METEATKAIEQFGSDSGLALLISEYAWLSFVLFALLLFKGTIENAVAGFSIFFGNEYNEDDIVIVNGRVGRITRVGITKTVFYLYSFRGGVITGGTKLAVENKSLPSMQIERPLPKLDPKDFYKDSEAPNGKQEQDN